MDQTKSESNNDGNSNSDLNESNANGKDCDTNSEHSSMMNGSIHSSYNNRYKLEQDIQYQFFDNSIRRL